jgi:hypothetical protein
MIKRAVVPCRAPPPNPFSGGACGLLGAGHRAERAHSLTFAVESELDGRISAPHRSRANTVQRGRYAGRDNRIVGKGIELLKTVGNIFSNG